MWKYHTLTNGQTQQGPSPFSAIPCSLVKVHMDPRSSWEVVYGERDTDRQTDRRADRCIDKQIDRRTNRYIDKQTDRQTGRYSDGQTKRDREV